MLAEKAHQIRLNRGSIERAAGQSLLNPERISLQILALAPCALVR
jgi:hypothetical protein